jgi:hypothetical protein
VAEAVDMCLGLVQIDPLTGAMVAFCAPVKGAVIVDQLLIR